MSIYEYRGHERDEYHGTPKVRTGRLKDHEICYVLRLRSSKSAGQVAEAMGVSAWWFSQMERGEAPVRRLLAYWADA